MSMVHPVLFLPCHGSDRETTAALHASATPRRGPSVFAPATGQVSQQCYFARQRFCAASS